MIWAICLLLSSACASQKTMNPVANTELSEEQTLQSGISGTVLWFEGNQMPTIESGPKKDPAKAVTRTLHFYQLTNRDKVVESNGFFIKVNTELVAKVETAPDGSFTVSLPPGKYSMFSQEEEGLWANLFEGNGDINPVVVQEGEITRLTFKINYRAAY